MLEPQNPNVESEVQFRDFGGLTSFFLLGTTAVEHYLSTSPSSILTENVHVALLQGTLSEMSTVLPAKDP